MKKLIELKSVTKAYSQNAQTFRALDNINLSLAEGEYVAIVGRSGSGKSTLINMLTGIDHPSKGSVIIGETYIHDLNENELAQWRGRNIGIVFQFFQLMPTLTILENILLAMEFVNVIRKEERRERALALLDLTGILRHKDKYPKELSGGEQQRAAIARALANDPPIIVADEPTGNLDSRTSLEIQCIFQRLAAEGKTVVIITHDTIHADIQRIITLEDGAVIMDESSQTELRPPNQKVFL